MTKRKIILLLPIGILLLWIVIYIWNRYTIYGIYEYDPQVIVDGTLYICPNPYNHYQPEDVLGEYIGRADGQLQNPGDFKKMKHLSSTVEGKVYTLKNAADMKWICLVPEYDENYVLICGNSDERYKEVSEVSVMTEKAEPLY